MPTTLEALAVFAGAIAPGYAFLSGYHHERSASTPERDLYVIAQAFLVSAIWIALTWWPAGHLLRGWAANDELGSHELVVWMLGCALLGLPYVVGRLIGHVIKIAAQGEGPDWLFTAIAAAGLFDKPALWDWIWERADERTTVVLVVVKLKDGSVIEGQFADQSKVDSSPRKPSLFLEKAYGYDESGAQVVYPEGAYLDGDEIVGVQFKS